MADRRQLEQAIEAQEQLRGSVPDAVIDVAVAALRESLALLGDAPPSDRRRQATVLFADVAGFTAWSSGMDAELVSALMNELWTDLDLVVSHHGGGVDKHIGDAVMAIWGAEQSRAKTIRNARCEPHSRSSPRSQGFGIGTASTSVSAPV